MDSKDLQMNTTYKKISKHEKMFSIKYEIENRIKNTQQDLQQVLGDLFLDTLQDDKSKLQGVKHSVIPESLYRA